VYFLSCKGKRVREVYNIEGKIYITSEVVDEKKNGLTRYYHENGKIKLEMIYINDSLTGKIYSYYENGDSEYEVNSENWEAKWYSKDRKTYMIGKLIDFKREGIWTEYLKKGDIKLYTWNYKNDSKNGKYYGFWNENKIKLVGNYKNDLIDGYLVFFDLNGKIDRIEFWKAGNENVSELMKEVDY
jgi:hypothetical protein